MNLYLKKQHSLVKNIVVLLIVILVFIGMLNIFQEQVRDSVYRISAPISKSFLNASSNLAGFFEPFLHAKELMQENQTLQQQNQNLAAQVALLEESLHQNQALGQLAQNTKADSFTTVAVHVIGLDAVNGLMLIDKGSDSNITDSMPLISAQKVVYGKVVKVYKGFSQVLLISSKQSLVNVKIQDADPTKAPIYGAIKGSGNLGVYLDLVSTDAEIKPGDVLVTSALEGIFPKDLLVGSITASTKNDLQPFQTARVQAYFDPQNTENLFVITNYKQEK